MREGGRNKVWERENEKERDSKRKRERKKETGLQEFKP
jgi:hypothetical protein